jgi:hypothetical protein
VRVTADLIQEWFTSKMPGKRFHMVSQQPSGQYVLLYKADKGSFSYDLATTANMFSESFKIRGRQSMKAMCAAVHRYISLPPSPP